MAVLIKGMSMPQTCSECQVECPDTDPLNKTFFICPIINRATDFIREGKRHKDCPMVKAKEPKPRESRAKLPCPKCGKKRLSVWCSADDKGNSIESIACDKCKIASAWSRTTIGAIRDWNKVVREWTVRFEGVR